MVSDSNGLSAAGPGCPALPRDAMTRALTAAEITTLLQSLRALWLHSGDQKAPHAVVSSGMCANGFIDLLRALRFSDVCRALGWQMAQAVDQHLRRTGFTGRINWVVGSDHSAAAFSHSVAEWFAAKHDFTEKSPDGRQRWERFQIEPDETVLQVEELITSARTTLAVRNGIREGNRTPVRYAPVVATLVHHSRIQDIEGAPIVYLAHYDIEVWSPGECPLCAAGSPALSPRTAWEALAAGG